MKFQDRIGRPDMGGYREVRFHGHVKVKLLDPKTRKVMKVVEGDNMQTDAVSLIMASNYYGIMDYEALKPIAKKLCGGVLAFQQPLTESASNMFPPISYNNPLVAHAGQNTYSSATADPKRGLPNDDPTLTGAITNGYKLVWDFPATQGNGTISSIALTHADTGDFWLYGGTDYSPINYKQGSATTGLQRCLPQIFNSSKREAYRIEGSGTTLTIQTISDYGIIKNLGIAQRPLSQIETSSVLMNEHTYTLPQNFGKMRYIYFESDNELHCIYPYTDGNNGKITKFVINLTSNTSSSDTVTVSKKLRVPQELSGYRIPFYTLDDDGYLYLVGNDSTKVVAVKYSNISSDTTREISAGTTIENVGDNVSLGLGHMGYLPYAGLIIDGTSARTAGNPYGTGLGQGIFSFYQKDGAPVYWTPYYNFQSGTWAAYSMSKMYMATVKNLEEPVLKSAAYAMQIEYTLTEEV